MTFLLKQIFNLVKLLNSDTGTTSIAAGFACGFVLGFSPAFSLQTILIIFLLFFFRIQIGAATLSAFFFKFIAWMLDPVSNTVGMKVLENESLKPLFTTLYNMPIIPLTRFYNSIVMGSGVVAICLTPFVFIASKIIIIKYREQIVARFQQTKVWKVVKATNFYKWYAKYDELY